jgi:hypothetical protein
MLVLKAWRETHIIDTRNLRLSRAKRLFPLSPFRNFLRTASRISDEAQPARQTGIMNSDLLHEELAEGIARAMYSRRGLLKRGGSGVTLGEDEEEETDWRRILIIPGAIILALLIVWAIVKLCVPFLLAHTLHDSIRTPNNLRANSSTRPHVHHSDPSRSGGTSVDVKALNFIPRPHFFFF